eukprot:TRINITY_DN12170_c0_g1_i1.p1 TRINITY_DN12170_c0_g1~~TRINITY_DN12170_c0_g1_i1.p1  ORF type:complete len:283 (-),score=80.18 TRINITY_DN12170_c0_g1_i1:52-900(-)
MADWEVSDKEKTSIINNFILNAPPGEFLEVVTDVRSLLGNDDLLNATAPQTFKEYNTEQMLVKTLDDDTTRVIICKFGEVGDNEYIDHASGNVVTFDHIKRSITGQRPIGSEVDSGAEPHRAALEAAAEQYVSDYFPLGTGAVYGSSSNGIVLTFVISSAIFNPNNFYNGRWRSAWIVNVDGNSATLTGNIKINVHYYEEGNVQLNTNTQKQANVGGGSPEELAENVVATIAKIEDELHAALDASYDNMSTTTFKALRRPLPITKTTVNWNRLAEYRLGSTM